MQWLKSGRQLSRFSTAALIDHFPTPAPAFLAPSFTTMATAVAEPVVKKAKTEYAHTREVRSKRLPVVTAAFGCHPTYTSWGCLLQPPSQMFPSSSSILHNQHDHKVHVF
jgi:hypothetical protein